MICFFACFCFKFTDSAHEALEFIEKWICRSILEDQLELRVTPMVTLMKILAMHSISGHLSMNDGRTLIALGEFEVFCFFNSATKGVKSLHQVDYHLSFLQGFTHILMTLESGILSDTLLELEQALKS